MVKSVEVMKMGNFIKKVGPIIAGLLIGIGIYEICRSRNDTARIVLHTEEALKESEKVLEESEEALENLKEVEDTITKMTEGT